VVVVLVRPTDETAGMTGARGASSVSSGRGVPEAETSASWCMRTTRRSHTSRPSAWSPRHFVRAPTRPD